MNVLYPSFVADRELNRLHANSLGIERPTSPIDFETLDVRIKELREKCDITPDSPTVDFNEALRLHNEEGYRPCGNCVQPDGEVSNWKECAERAEAEVRELRKRVAGLEERVRRSRRPGEALA